MAAKTSAGLLMYRRRQGRLELLVAHPGGPYFRHKHEHAWTIPKGVVDNGEDLLDAAQREFEEETGFSPRAAEFLPLGDVRQRSGKRVHAWAFEGDCDPTKLASNDFEMEWPPKSGKSVMFPEVDELRFASPADARRLLNKSQSAFVDRLLEVLAERDAAAEHEAERPAQGASES